MRRAGRVLDPWQQDSSGLLCSVRPDGKWACFEYGEVVSRQCGKGVILEARALGGLFLFNEELIMWSAHEYKTAMEAFRRVLGLLVRLGTRVSDNLIRVDGSLVKVINTNGEESLERLDTGQRLKFLARSKGSGRGFSGDVNIIDEAFAYTRAQQEALMPTMSARPNPQIIYTSSPPLAGDAGEVMYALRRRAQAGGDDALGWRDWGLPGSLDDVGKVGEDGRPLVDVADPANWAAANPALGGRLTVEFVARELRSMSAEGFARERLGIWPAELAADGGEIDAQLWADLADPDSRRQGGITIAWDITPARDRSSIAITGGRADELLHWEIIDHRPGTHWVVDRLVALKARHDPLVIAVDGKGPGASLIPALNKAGIIESEDRDKPRRGDLVVLAAQDMADAFALFVDAARQDRGRHRDQPQLNSALAGANTRPLGDGGQAWGRRGSSDISPLVAITVANWAYETRAHLVQVDAPNIW